MDESAVFIISVKTGRQTVHRGKYLVEGIQAAHVYYGATLTSACYFFLYAFATDFNISAGGWRGTLQWIYREWIQIWFLLSAFLAIPVTRPNSPIDWYLRRDNITRYRFRVILLGFIDINWVVDLDRHFGC